jgi:hypothetical protein
MASQERTNIPMQITLIVTLVLHVLSGVFWAGSTFALARTGGNLADQLFKPQMGAAAVAVATGALLWFLLNRGASGTPGHILALGALSAVIAAGVQGMMGGQALRQLSVASGPEASSLRDRMATGQRIAASLLGVTVICMAAARYA